MTALFELAPGALFAGDFRVVRPLRSGGMGAIYVVEQLSTGKLRALKQMRPEIVAQPGLRRRFELEARVGARIKSDHVVEVIASGVDPASGAPWLAMELLEGEDLASYTQRKGPLSPAEVRAIADPICHALGEAHREAIVHRDLKPENVFLAAPRRRGLPFMVKVLDFGIARIVAEAQTTSGVTQSGLGTPLWMAPEQAEPGAPIAPGTDVWALGLLVFWMLTGRYFWRSAYAESATVMMFVREMFGRPHPSASTRAAELGCEGLIPEGFDAWFARCLAEEAADRYADAAEAYAALEEVLGGAEAVDRGVERASIAPDTGAAPRPSLSGDTEAMPSPPSFEAPLQSTSQTMAGASVTKLSDAAADGAEGLIHGGPARESRRPRGRALWIGLAGALAILAGALSVWKLGSPAGQSKAAAAEVPGAFQPPMAALVAAPIEELGPSAAPSNPAPPPPPAPNTNTAPPSINVDSGAGAGEPSLCRPGGGKRNGAVCASNEECCSDRCARGVCRRSPRRPYAPRRGM